MKKTRLFKHFITLIHCCALAIPLFTLIGTFIFNYLAPAAYFASHKNGNQSTYDVQYKYQSNEVNSADDLVEGNIYQLNCNDNAIDDLLNVDTTFFFKLITQLDISYTDLGVDEAITNFSCFTPDTYINIGYDYYDNTNDIYICTYYSIEQYNYDDYLINYDYFGTFKSNCIIQYISGDIKASYLEYTNYNEIESVEIENYNDFDDMKNYQPKTFDDACFYTMKSLGAFKYEGDSLDDMLDSHYNYDLDDVLDLYLGFDDLTTPTYRTGVVNYDWFELFNVNGAIKNNQSSWLFFVNYYINYFINISIICFMPIVIMCFFKMCTNLVLKFTEKGDY